MKIAIYAKKYLYTIMMICVLMVTGCQSSAMRIDGKLSTPLDIQKVYDFVSNKKDLSIDKLSEIIAGNLKKAFGIEIEHIL